MLTGRRLQIDSVKVDDIIGLMQTLGLSESETCGAAATAFIAALRTLDGEKITRQSFLDLSARPDFLQLFAHNTEDVEDSGLLEQIMQIFADFTDGKNETPSRAIRSLLYALGCHDPEHQEQFYEVLVDYTENDKLSAAGLARSVKSGRLEMLFYPNSDAELSSGLWTTDPHESGRQAMIHASLLPHDPPPPLRSESNSSEFSEAPRRMSSVRKFANPWKRMSSIRKHRRSTTPLQGAPKSEVFEDSGALPMGSTSAEDGLTGQDAKQIYLRRLFGIITRGRREMKESGFGTLLADSQLSFLLPDSLSPELASGIFLRLDTDKSGRLGFFEFWEAFESMYTDDGELWQRPERRDFRHAVFEAMREEISRQTLVAERRDHNEDLERTQFQVTIAELREQLLLYEDTDESNRDTIRKLTEEIADLKHQLAMHENVTEKVPSQRSSMIGDNSALKHAEAEILLLKEALEEKERYVQTQQRLHADELGRLSDVIRSYEEAQLENAERDAERDRLQNELNAANKLASQLQMSFQDMLDEKASENEGAVAKLTVVVAELQADRSRLTTELDRTQKEHTQKMATATARISELEAELHEALDLAERRAEEGRVVDGELHATLSALEDEKRKSVRATEAEKIAAQNKELQVKISNLEHSIAEQNAEHAAAELAHIAELESLRKQLSVLTVEENRLRADLAVKAAESESKSARVRDLEERLSSSQAKVAKLEATLSSSPDVKALEQHHHAEIIELRAQVEAEKSTRSRLEQEISSLEIRYSDVSRQIRNLEIDVASERTASVKTRSDLAEKEKTIATLQAQLAKLEATHKIETEGFEEQIRHLNILLEAEQVRTAVIPALQLEL